MASTPRQPGGESTAATVPFSYAQAAKGISATPSIGATSKPTSGTLTPAKDSGPVPTALSPTPGMNWAEDAESSEASTEKPAEKENKIRDAQANGVSSSSQAPTIVSVASSPELGASSTSTVIKDDDVSSLQNNSSESTWENKSQASNPTEKPVDLGDQGADKPSSNEAEKPFAKPLQEAPIPSVNIWKQRANEFAKSKAPPVNVALKASPQASNGIASDKGTRNDGRKAKSGVASDGADLKSRVPQEERSNQARRDVKVDAEGERSRKGPKPRSYEKETKPSANVLPLPPDRDQESWPTPDIAVDEERKKAQEKGERVEKDRPQGTPLKGNREWITVPINPNVIFNTPLPNTAPTRRGGRGGGRGASQANTRGNAYATNAANDAASLPNGESKRGRPEGLAVRDASPSKTKGTTNSGPPSLNETASAGLSIDKGTKSANVEHEAPARKSAAPGEVSSGQNPTYPPRQFPSGRPKQGRKGDAPADRRREGDLVSPTKDNTPGQERRGSAVAQAEEEGRLQNLGEGPHSHKQTGSERRGGAYGSISSRDREHRGRGNMRGGRGGNHAFQNSHHQFAANGHIASLQSPTTMQLPRSPTNFHPDVQNAFFTPSSHGRGFRSNNPRSHSVTTDNMYGRLSNGYPNGQQPIAPIQTYMGQVPYEYHMVQPMSAVPYSSFVDPYTLSSMVTTQLEYYFSVDNLCKDLYLRKHMDSKGFIFLSKIADFNRIKSLTSDLELIKLVCHQSSVIEYRVGTDGKDRLRRKDGWEQWVLNIPDRDSSAQNDGPEELHHPPVPHPQGFDSQYSIRHPDVPSRSQASPMRLGAESLYAVPNGVHSSVPPNIATTNGDLTNGRAAPLNASHHDANGEPDSFSNEQVESLSVIVRKQDQDPQTKLPPSASRTFSNGSIDSKAGVSDEADLRQSNLKVNGTGPSQGEDSKIQDGSRRSRSPFSPSHISAMSPVRLFWVKGKDKPVESLPPDATYEFYTHLRSKALEQRQNATPSNCPYDMDVLYQFWSHFLIRNFNTQMYDEFRQFAFEDISQNLSDVGIKNLIKYYGESLLSQHAIRERVARHYVNLVNSEHPEQRGPAFDRLKSAWKNDAVTPGNRTTISKFIDDNLKSSLEQ